MWGSKKSQRHINPIFNKTNLGNTFFFFLFLFIFNTCRLGYNKVPHVININMMS